ncbi:hypothetical protein FJV76_13710 [Mesorhizobium sp. WSM4303]|uniref:hypothetical protein n=1 Tax=unclassified Mesorhizobium TaxID=325217 RepID=UPI00115EBB5B|nr:MULTISPECIES: hypothetical protein [unclassified Mesorhizobium]TRC98354.1 hypothetical protein FJV77_07820 [Mesorhizobium sp. WSM4306]TRD04331.1 hypothetical protein FJV76_13710 [Mesorhizobium sp. WSM4303]
MLITALAREPEREQTEPADGNMRCPFMVDYLKSFIQELLPVWLSRKAVDVYVRPVERQPPMRDMIGPAPPVRYRGTIRSEPCDYRFHEHL